MTRYGASITAITYHLPATRVTNADLAASNPTWQPEKIESKTGIAERRIAGPQETASDLAIAAARKLLSVASIAPSDIDYVILCTQSPDYLLPTNACLIQEALGIPTDAGAFDMNLGCSGFVYGLGLCKGLIETGQASRILFLTTDTYSKHINPEDRSVRTIFGDAAAATLIERVPVSETPAIGPFRYGTNGKGGKDLVVPNSGMRAHAGPAEGGAMLSGGSFGPQWLYMNGPAVFTFTLSVVPKLVADMLSAANMTLDDVAMVVPHQANAYMLETLRKRLKLPAEKFFIDVKNIGNTVSATIPIALVTAALQGRVKSRQRIMLLGFGIGLSWAGAMLEWQDVKVGFSDGGANG